MTLGTELAEHRYPDSPRRLRVLRCRRDLGRYGCWLRAALRRNRHDNPVGRVSVALSTESQRSRRNYGIRCAATLLAASSDIRKKPPGSALLAHLGSTPRVRQLCAKGQMRRSHPRSRRRRVERPVINPPSANGPTGTRSNSVSLAGRPPRTLSPECQQPCQKPCQKPSNCRSETTSANSSTTSPPATTAGEEHRQWHVELADMVYMLGSLDAMRRTDDGERAAAAGEASIGDSAPC